MINILFLIMITGAIYVLFTQFREKFFGINAWNIQFIFIFLCKFFRYSIFVINIIQFYNFCSNFILRFKINILFHLKLLQLNFTCCERAIPLIVKSHLVVIGDLVIDVTAGVTVGAASLALVVYQLIIVLNFVFLRRNM